MSNENTFKVWNWHNPTSVLCGVHACKEIHFPSGVETILIVTTVRGREQARDYHLFSDEALNVIWLDTITPNPSLNFLREAIKDLRKYKFEAVVGFGGGSSLDAAKVLSAVLNQKNTDVDLQKYISEPNLLDPRCKIPMYAVPTTFGTGSEVTPFATVWDTKLKKKLSLVSDILFPEFAFVDPKLSLNTPKSVIYSTGLDALNQAFESIWNKNATELTKSLATTAISKALIALDDISNDVNLDSSRLLMAESSLLAGMCISQTRTAVCHSISYPLTAHFQIPHGFACAFTMLEVAKIVSLEAPQLFNELSLKAGFISSGKLIETLRSVLMKTNLAAEINQKIKSKESLINFSSEMLTLGRSDNFILDLDDDLIIKILLRSFKNI
ncbi:phosphonoacetaldehyde reductase [Emcibacteraceae bacterium]|nr:phosphonoacetaldehyde reductase [Emcibacteraceae bacterium]